MLTKERKSEIVKKFGTHEKDTGNPAAQIALLSEHINDLMPHFTKNPKDHLSRRGLLVMVGQRRRLLNHLRRSHPKRYVEILRDLKLRK